MIMMTTIVMMFWWQWWLRPCPWGWPLLASRWQYLGSCRLGAQFGCLFLFLSFTSSPLSSCWTSSSSSSQSSYNIFSKLTPPPPQHLDQEDPHATQICKLKMAIILPTGQWYAPSAVINDAWYCMVWHCIAWCWWYCMVSHGMARYCMVRQCIA